MLVSMKPKFEIKIRKSWGELCPVTKVIPSKRKYNRKRDKKNLDID